MRRSTRKESIDSRKEEMNKSGGLERMFGNIKYEHISDSPEVNTSRNIVQLSRESSLNNHSPVGIKDKTQNLASINLSAEVAILSEKLKNLSEIILPLEKSLKNDRLELDLITKELKEKLAWLPMNLNHIKDKPPNEARIFTVELRLRMEESLRVEQFNKLASAINYIKSELLMTGIALNHPNYRQLKSGRPRTRHNDNMPSVDAFGNPESYKLSFDNEKSRTDNFNKPERLKNSMRKVSCDIERSKNYSIM